MTGNVGGKKIWGTFENKIKKWDNFEENIGENIVNLKEKSLQGSCCSKLPSELH